MKPQLKKILIIILVIAAAAGVIYYAKNNRPIDYQEGLYPVNPELEGETIVLKDYVRYPGENGKNAFELLKTAVSDKVDFKQYDFGVFVEGIGGFKPDADHFWKLYVNGKEAQTAADTIVTEDDYVIEWVVEKVNK